MAVRLDIVPSVHQIENGGLPSMEPLEKPYRLVHLDSGNFTLLSATNKVWKDVVSDRVGESRSRKGESPERMSDFLEDKGTYEKYNTVMGYMRKASEESLENPDIVPYVLVDADTNIPQAMSALEIKADHVYLRALISAPWNIRMHGRVPDECAERVTRGSGTALMYATYKLAQRSGRPVYKTTPLSGAFKYYEGLGMDFDAESSHFTLPVEDSVPMSLRKYREYV